MSVTVEDAQHCPKCGNPGETTVDKFLDRHTKARVYVMKCNNSLCLWYNTTWLVQVKADGSLAQRKAGQKDFEALSPQAERLAEATLQEVRDLGLA